MALREILAHFGVEVETDKLEKADDHVEEFIGKLKQLAGVLVGGEVAKGVFEFGARISEQGEQLEQTAIRLGIGTDALQSLNFAASQAGAGMGQLTFALLTLQDKIGDALVNKSGEGSKSFSKLGISMRGANGEVKDAGELLEAVADRIAKAKTQAEKVSIAMEAFGRQGRSLLPLLEKGSAGIAELREEFEALGGGMREKAVKAAVEYQEQMHRLKVVHDGLTGQIGVVLLPVLGRLVDWLVKGERAMIDVADKSSIVQTVLGGLGAVLTVFAVKSAIAFAPWLVWAAALAAVLLVVEDIVTMFGGGDTLLGRFLDTVGGKGFHVEVVKELKDEWQNLHDVFRELGPVFHEFVEELRWIYNFGKAVAEIVGKISGGAGDAAARVRNYLVEKGVVDGGPKTSGGRDFDTNEAIKQAGLMNDAVGRGDSFSPTSTPAYYANRGAAGRDEWLTVISQWGEFLKKQNANVIASTPLGLAPGMGVFHQTNEIHVHDAHDAAKTAKVVHEVIKDRARVAADRLHKKAESK